MSGKIFLHDVPPNGPTFTIFIGALLEEGELRSSLTDESVQAKEFRLKFKNLGLLTFHANVTNYIIACSNPFVTYLMRIANRSLAGIIMDVSFTVDQWILLGVGAFATGLSKTGLPGLGVLTVGCFANALPARESTGALLPLLIVGDLFAVGIFRKHANWAHLWKLFPWVLPGILAGALALDRVSNAQVERIIGGILLGMICLQFWWQRNKDRAATNPHGWWIAAGAGFLAGFTTMVANAAGPVMIIYLLAAGLPKLEFIGTGAWFFLFVNLFKVPFSAGLGLITPGSLVLDACLVLPLLPGVLLGPLLVRHINQRVFELIATTLTLVATARLLF